MLLELGVVVDDWLVEALDGVE